jgi:hypothetical protein
MKMVNTQSSKMYSDGATISALRDSRKVMPRLRLNW